jgi:drug/metabolite transporter (DMT)-like permease
MTLLSTLMMLPFGIYYWETPAAENIFWAFMVAAFAIFNVFAIVTALKYAGIGTLMPFDFTRLIVTAILAYFLFDERLDVLTLIGAVIILSSAIYVVRKEHASY